MADGSRKIGLFREAGRHFQNDCPCLDYRSTMTLWSKYDGSRLRHMMHEFQPLNYVVDVRLTENLLLFDGVFATSIWPYVEKLLLCTPFFSPLAVAAVVHNHGLSLRTYSRRDVVCFVFAAM